MPPSGLPSSELELLHRVPAQGVHSFLSFLPPVPPLGCTAAPILGGLSPVPPCAPASLSCPLGNPLKCGHWRAQLRRDHSLFIVHPELGRILQARQAVSRSYWHICLASEKVQPPCRPPLRSDSPRCIAVCLSVHLPLRLTLCSRVPAWLGLPCGLPSPLRCHTQRLRTTQTSVGMCLQEVGRHKARRRHLELDLGSVVLPHPLCLRFLSCSSTLPSAPNLCAPLPRPQPLRAKFCTHTLVSRCFCRAAWLALRPQAPRQCSGESQCTPLQPALLVLPPTPGLALRSIRALSRLTLAAFGGNLFSTPPLTPAHPTLLAGATSLRLWAPCSKALGCGPQCRRAPPGSRQAQGRAVPFGAQSWLCGATLSLVPPLPLPLADAAKCAKSARPWTSLLVHTHRKSAGTRPGGAIWSSILALWCRLVPCASVSSPARTHHKRAKPVRPPPSPLVPTRKVLRLRPRPALLLRCSPACAPPSSTPPNALVKAGACCRSPLFWSCPPPQALRCTLYVPSQGSRLLR